jgi:hypothetical protein
MKKNMGSYDRIIRFTLAMIVIALYFTNVITDNIALVLLFVIGIFMITSILSFCPIYFPFGISSRKKEDQGKI